MNSISVWSGAEFLMMCEIEEGIQNCYAMFRTHKPIQQFHHCLERCEACFQLPVWLSGLSVPPTWGYSHSPPSSLDTIEGFQDWQMLWLSPGSGLTLLVCPGAAPRPVLHCQLAVSLLEEIAFDCLSWVEFILRIMDWSCSLNHPMVIACLEGSLSLGRLLGFLCLSLILLGNSCLLW